VYKVVNLHPENHAQCNPRITAVVPVTASNSNTLHLFLANRFRLSLLFVLPSPEGMMAVPIKELEHRSEYELHLNIHP
jgi:hypothetical protein